MKESDIVAEAGNYWVYKDKRGYHVMRPYHAVASITDSSYPLTNDGKSIALARMNYLYNRGGTHNV